MAFRESPESGASSQYLFGEQNRFTTTLNNMAMSKVSMVGIDFGSHITSIALWFEEKDTIEVIADDLGSRTIPSAVAYRGDEIITGQSAISQMHKNTSNSFDDIRSMLLDPSLSKVHIPLLDKEVTIQELGSHFFRNIHNQIKQQVGAVVRECIISVPYTLDEAVRKRLVESAQAGGMRIKACLNDSVCALLAYKLDDGSKEPAKTLVIDIGWSKTTIALYDVSGGLFFSVADVSITEASGNVFVNLMASHCAKDFTRKHKIPCEDNKRSMLRLRRECENAMKSLSTSAEAMIDIDSLCEGIDFSLKLSKARFEDLIAVPIMHLKNAINTLLQNAGWSIDAVEQVCLSGGGSAIPKAMTTLKSLFPEAKFLVGRFESSEAQCIGAASHGKYLVQQGLIDSVPVQAPLAPCLTRAIYLATSSKGSDAVQVLPPNTVLPVKIEFPAVLPAGQLTGYIKLLVEGAVSADPQVPVGELSFTLDASTENNAVSISIIVSTEGEIQVDVFIVATKAVIGQLKIPTSA